MNTTERMVQGSIDMHVHHAPDAHIRRRVDALQAALQAEEAGMRAIVLKNHDYPTAPLAHIVNQSVRNLTVFGSISLDFAIGGLNPSAVETSALLGAKVVWMPTFSSANDRERLGFSGEGIRILNEKGKIVPALQDILDIVKSHDMVLATGHVSAAEAFALVDEAKRKGITKIVVTHPLETRVGAALSIEEQQQMAEKGAFIEHCFLCTMPLGDRLDPMKIVEAVRAVGAERCLLTTDLGQDWNPPPAEGMRMMVATLLRCKLSIEEIELMIKANPTRLLGLTSE
ncbi:MAG: hypothetical protein HYY80_01685 [Chloroflexi bacterium]|nr:hypothetical protein [Chloroflexota bacterium]MBI3930620.1 hypothetical protein [Chloroflexota bacterium]